MWYAYWILFIDISLLEALKYDGYNTSHTYPTPKLPCCDAQFLMLSAVAVGQKIAQPRWVEAPLCRPGVDSLRRESGQTLWLGKLPVVVTGILALQRCRVSRKSFRKPLDQSAAAVSRETWGHLWALEDIGCQCNQVSDWSVTWIYCFRSKVCHSKIQGLSF